MFYYMETKLKIDQMLIHIFLNTPISVFNKYTEIHSVRGLFDKYEKYFVATFFDGNNRHYSIVVSDFLNENGLNNEQELNGMSYNLKCLKRSISLRVKYMSYSSELGELVTLQNEISEKYNTIGKPLNDFIKEFRKFKSTKKCQIV